MRTAGGRLGMRSQHSLPVKCLSDCPQSAFKTPLHTPAMSRCRFGQSHVLQYRKMARQVVRPDARQTTVSTLR
jgi:hypothetical protein